MHGIESYGLIILSSAWSARRPCCRTGSASGCGSRPRVLPGARGGRGGPCSRTWAGSATTPCSVWSRWRWSFILFDGGMHIGWRRFRAAAAAIVWLGRGGHLRHRGRRPRLLAHLVFGLGWTRRPAAGHGAVPHRPGRGVLGAGPARGRRAHRHPARGRVRGQRPGRASRCWSALLGAAGSPARGVGRHAAVEFVLQMVVGAGVGVVGGLAAAVVHAPGAAAERGRCTRCGRWPARCSSSGWPRWRTGRASWPCSWPGSGRRRTGAVQGGDRAVPLPRWPAWPRSSRSWCSA